MAGLVLMARGLPLGIFSHQTQKGSKSGIAFFFSLRNSISDEKSMSKTDFKALFELILMYFSDKEIKSFVNSIRKSEANEMDIIGEFDLEEGCKYSN